MLLQTRAITQDAFATPVRTLAGVDVAYTQDEKHVFAAVVILDAESLQMIDCAHAMRAVEFPYVPGLFAFRELPAILEALDRIKTVPDIIICDGHGIAHPRRFGLASHLGVLCDLPTIGAGKSRLIGTHDALGVARGSMVNLVDPAMDNEIMGRVLRTQTDIKPIYVSVGHRISITTACEWVLKSAARYRLPETTREADRMVNQLRREYMLPRSTQAS